MTTMTNPQRNLDYLDFADAKDPNACARLLSLNPYANVLVNCAYSVRDLNVKLAEAVGKAREDGVLQSCTCGNCGE